MVAADIDLGLLALPVSDSRFEHAVILNDRFLVAVAPDHTHHPLRESFSTGLSETLCKRP